MTEYVLVSDNINGKERAYLQAMKTVLENGNNTAEILGVGPGVLQRYGKTSSSTGKIAVFLVGGSDIGTYYDFANGIGRYYNFKYCWFAFASWTASTWITCEELANRKLVRAHDDNFSGSYLSKYTNGSYTAKKYFDENKGKIYYVCGDSPEDLAKKILKGGGGSDSDSEGTSQPSTIKEALKKLMSYCDGEIECRVIGNKVYINKIKNPSDTEILISEGSNIIDGSVSIKDYYPNTPNVLKVNFNDEEIVYKNQLLIDRFGEIEKVVDAVKIVDDKEVAVETIEEARHFALLEFSKLKRDNGHSIDLKVIPDREYRVGEWVRVYIPTYNEDGYMYITKVSKNITADGVSEISLTLADYPPSFGEFQEESEEEDEELEETEEEETTDE